MRVAEYSGSVQCIYAQGEVIQFIYDQGIFNF